MAVVCLNLSTWRCMCSLLQTSFFSASEPRLYAASCSLNAQLKDFIAVDVLNGLIRSSIPPRASPQQECLCT